MPNTDRFQSLPDFFKSREEGKSAIKENSNPRYKFFRQVHFTAGDYDQFLQYWDTSSHLKEGSPLETIRLPSQIDSPLYDRVSTDDVFGTFEYIFHKFKKGIFVKFVDNELRVFLPFSKVDYTNDWSDRIFTDTNLYKDFDDLFIKSSELSGYKIDPKKIHFMKDHWYANNGLLRNEYPISENDSGVSTLRDMFLCLSKERCIPDCEFFVNKRDFPILKNDHTEPYDCIFGPNQPLLSFDRPHFCPILGMTTTDEHSDITIPTWEDWARVEFPQQKWFGKEFALFPDPFIPFSQKSFPTAVFRGASTGLGTTPSTNPRLYFSLLSRKKIKDSDGFPFLDCGITKWNCRPRRNSHSEPYRTFDPLLKQQIGTANFLPMTEQAKYKYILHLPGHSESYRLSYELATGSVILMWPCSYKLWFSHLLVPFVHYVPVQDHDIFSTLRWCKENEEKCAEIARQARLFYETHLHRNGILDYWQHLLFSLSKKTGQIRFATKGLFNYQQEIQKRYLIQEKNKLQSTQLPEDWSGINGSQLRPSTFQRLLYMVNPDFILKEIDKAPIHKESRNVILKKIKLFGRTLCVKSPKLPNERDLLHETFVGQMGLNKFANIYPFVVFIFGKWGDHILMDFIEGETFEQALQKRSTSSVVDFFLEIFLQILILLSSLQNEIGFIHFDLYPWNIVIRKNTEKKKFSFPLQNGQSVSFCPKEYPVLIDMGKSHFVYQNTHFVNVAPFRLHFYQDIISILISGIFQVLHHHKLVYKDIQRVIRIFHHIAPSSYTNHKPITNLTFLKNFIRTKKKFSNMLLDEKREFQFKQPLDYFWFFQKTELNPNIFHIEKKETDLLNQMEIYCSRYFIEHEIHSSLGLSTSFIWESFKKERIQESIGKSIILKVYNELINWKLGKIIFPERDIPFPSVYKLVNMDWSKEQKSTQHSSIQLPRFFSHPNLQVIEDESCLSRDNHFMDRHKILLTLFSSTEEFPELQLFRKKLFTERQHYLYNPFLHFHSVSISHHLVQYKKWLLEDEPIHLNTDD